LPNKTKFNPEIFKRKGLIFQNKGVFYIRRFLNRSVNDFFNQFIYPQFTEKRGVQ